ncbi:hypothetical protein [Flavobacterium sp.]|uniref:hypothetical protein n=1 Tax=Flavobacterium sp. TaxID=239 RepID=UPI003751DB16
MSENEKSSKVGIITVVITALVTLSTAVITNFDKIYSKGKDEPITVNDTLSFEYKFDKIIKDCPNDYSNIISGLKDETEEDKDYYSKVNFTEGENSITISSEDYPTFNLLIYTGSDSELAFQKRLEITKKVGEHLQTKAVTNTVKEDGYQQMISIYEKGNVEITIVDAMPENDPAGSEIVMMTINKKG